MKEYTFRPARREGLGLFIGLAGGTDSGKTFSAMKMAKGIVGPGQRFAVIDTESRRASHYADFFDFDVFDLDAPYSSDRYEAACKAAVAAGYKAIVVDSASHEHDGAGGYLDMQAEDLDERVERAKKKNPNANEWDLIEKLTPLSWNRPKKLRKRMMQTLLACSTSIPIIFCFRAEEKVFASKDGKLVAQNPPVWTPLCGKGMPFEMTVFFMLHRENRGIPKPIKLQAQHASLFPLDKPLDEASGRAIAAWVAGEKHEPITADQVKRLQTEAAAAGASIEKLLAKAGAASLETLPASKFDASLAWISRHKQATTSAGDVETATLRKIDTAKDRDAAAEILDALDRDTPLYARASEAYKNRWGAAA